MISLSIIIPCLNEEENIDGTVLNLVSALHGRVEDFEILIFNDASTDGTQAKIEELSRRYWQVRPIHLTQHCGVGQIFLKGIELAQKKYLMILGGDNEIPQASLRTIFDAVGGAEIVFTYMSNPQARAWYRRLISRGFTALMRLVSGTRLRYYNGPGVYPLETLRRLEISYTAFGFLAEIAVRLLRAKRTFREVPFEISPRQGPSRLFRLASVVGGLQTLSRIGFERFDSTTKLPHVSVTSNPV